MSAKLANATVPSGLPDRLSEDLVRNLIVSYRVRQTGKGVVVSRKTLEHWLEEGDAYKLGLVVDPRSGKPLEAFLYDQEFFYDICDPKLRDDLVKRRESEVVGEVFSIRDTIHQPNGKRDLWPSMEDQEEWDSMMREFAESQARYDENSRN